MEQGAKAREVPGLHLRHDWPCPDTNPRSLLLAKKTGALTPTVACGIANFLLSLAGLLA